MDACNEYSEATQLSTQLQHEGVDNDMNDPNEQDAIKVWQDFHHDNIHLWTPRRKTLELARPAASGALSDDFLKAAEGYDDCCQRLQHELSDRLRTAGLTLQKLKGSLTDSEANVLRLMTTQVLEHIHRTGNVPWAGLTTDLGGQLIEDSEPSDEEPEELAVDAMVGDMYPFAVVPPSALAFSMKQDPAKGLPWYSREYKKPAAMHQPATQHLTVPSMPASSSAGGPSGNSPPVPAVARTASSDARFSAYSLVSDADTRGTSPLPPVGDEDKWDIDFYGGYADSAH